MNFKDLAKDKIAQTTEILVESPFKKVLLSFIKPQPRQFFKEFKIIVENIYKKDKMKQIIKENNLSIVEDFVWDYYKKDYPVIILTKMMIYEYLLDLIGNDICYIEIEDIHNYLDEIFIH